MDWSTLYSDFIDNENTNSLIKQLKKPVEFADIGCGYGGLLGSFSLFIIYFLSFMNMLNYLFISNYFFL